MSYRFKKSYRRRHHRAERGWPRILGMVVAAAALFVFGGLPVLRSSPPALRSDLPFTQRTSEVAAYVTSSNAVSMPAGPNYNYSVIPGGARSAQELARAIQTDEVVADHYRAVDPATMHPQTVSVERMAHVSYRINDRVFWTKKPVRIYEGETILTNGETQIRARCGNAISMAPLLPTSDDEPESTELDALTDTGPMLVAFDLAPAGVPSALAWPFGDIGGDGPVMAPVLPPFGGGGGGFGSGANGGQANDGILEDAPGDIATASSSTCVPASGVNVATVNSRGERSRALAEGDPCEVDFSELDSELDSSELGPSGFGPPGFDSFGFDPSGFDPFGFDPSGFDPSGPGFLVLQPLLGPESDPTTFAATDATPVPEPATLVLLGSGIAGLLARHRRQKSKDRCSAKASDNQNRPHSSRRDEK